MVIRSTPVHRPVRSSAEKSTQSILPGALGQVEPGGHLGAQLAVMISGFTPSTESATPGHARVGDVARVVGQQALVSGGHMGVGAEQGRHPAVGIKAQGRFSPVASAWKSTMHSLGRSGVFSRASRVSKGQRRLSK